MNDIFKRAQQIRKSNPNKSWKDCIKMAAGKKSVSSSNQNTMPIKKRRKAAAKPRSRAVGAVRTVTRTRTVKAKTKRRNVGAIIDKTMLQVAGGMALTSIAQGMIEPLRARVPASLAKLVDPALIVVGYMGSQRLKNPIAKGVCLGIMAEGVKNTTQLVMGMVKKNAAPTITPGPGAPGAPAGGGQPIANMGYYMQLPSFSGMGNIPQVITDADNPYATLPNMGNVDGNVPYLPLGWDK